MKESSSHPPVAGHVVIADAGGVSSAPEVDWERAAADVAAARIMVWRDVLQSIHATADAEVMACCAAIRREHPDREDFTRWCAGRLGGVLSPADAWRRAETWEVARHHRPIRELTLTQPRKAIALVAEFAQAADGEQIDLPLDADDQQITDILASPPKVRRERLRALAAAGRAARKQRHPDDVARIAELERESAAAETSAAKRKAALVAELAAHERGLAETAGRLGELVAQGAFSDHELGRVLRLCDMATASLETIADAVHERREAT